MKRSYRHLFMGAVGVALLLSNCTVKEDSDESCEKGDKVNGCECPGGVTGHQECESDGSFGSCICPGGVGGSGNTSGSNTGGNGDDEGGAPGGGIGGISSAGSGGASDAGAGAGGALSEGGADGAGGEPPFAFETCTECLETLCADEWEACAAADQGICEMQYGAVADCIEADRANGPNGTNVTRDRLRGCGVTLGSSANPNLAGDWAPAQMAQETTDLINCLATSSSELPDDEWANVNGPNFPQSGPTPWPADSCAKLACTSPVPE
jgi:hypothetical protein